VQNLGGFYLENGLGQTYPLINLNIGSTNKTIINIPLNSGFNLNQDSNTLYLKNSAQNTLDKISYNHFASQTYKRTPDGIGTWGFTSSLSNPQIDLNLNYRPLSHKIILSIFNIPDDIDIFNYEIIYKSGKEEKSIFGSIRKDDLIDSKIDREFYLGTCSTGGVCSPDANLFPNIKVNLYNPNLLNNSLLVTKSFQVF
jgi:hypothetical protein